MQYYLAVDIGASSGRHILGHTEKGRMILEEIYRFDNTQISKNGHDCWDVDALWNSILEGLRACKEAGKIPVTMGIDTWAVDFVLLNSAGKMLGDAVAYRDKRTAGMDAAVNARISPEELYAHTGIQKQLFNTIYQLAALQTEHPEQLASAAKFLMIPEYFNYLLTGKAQNEYTNATSTNLVNAQSKTWDTALLETLGLPAHMFGTLAMPGTRLGRFTSEVAQQVGFSCEVILPATHDTGSAFLAVPARDDNAVCISSGTWSLLGVENTAPITSELSRAQNFTNEGGYDYRFRYLKNIMGLWMIQSVRRELNGTVYVAGREQRAAVERQWSYAELESAARAAHIATIVDVNDARFLAPDSMIQAVKDASRDSGLPVPETVGELMHCIYHSLAHYYGTVIKSLQTITGKTYTSINIVGGGSKDGYLNQLTAEISRLPVFAGPTEGTALGNLIVQMLIGGDYTSLSTAREGVKLSFVMKEFLP